MRKVQWTRHEKDGDAELTETFCREWGIVPSYVNVLLMVDNWLPGFDMEEQKAMDKKTEEHLAGIITDVHNRRRMISEVTDADRAVHQQFLQNMEKLPDDAWKKLVKVMPGCEGCGICTKVCPSGSMQMEKGKAILGMNVPEKNPNVRYRNARVRLEEIMAANNQGNA